MTGRLVQPIVTTLLVLAGIVALLISLPSLIGLLMVIVLIAVLLEVGRQRRRSYESDLNSALRAAARHRGAVEKVAMAFSRSGPLRGQCYEYSRRMLAGEDPVEAAAPSRIPLELATAVALESNRPDQTPASQAAEIETDLVDRDPGGMPVQAQMIYLTLTALATVLVLAFISAMVLPTLDKISTEFGIRQPYRNWLGSGPALLVLALVATITLIVFPILNRADRLHSSGFVPLLPPVARRKVNLLLGLADAIEAGWPLGRGLAIAHTISLSRRERARLETAMQVIERGESAEAGLRRGGWISAAEEQWLAGGASPARMARWLRVIADQNLRDAAANLQLLVSITFPVMVILIGVAVLIYAYGFLGNLMELVRALS